MDLRHVRRHWNVFAGSKPMWSNLTGPELGDRSWDPEAFLATGEAEIAATLRRANELGVAPRTRSRALDFGCGVGRLTQALGRRFSSADGVDIARAMLREARRHDRTGGRCRFHLNTSGHLRQFEDGTFDFVYSNLVLQHMEPVDALRYIAEMGRILAPGGLLVFLVPRAVPGRPDESVALPAGADRTRRAAPLTNTACRARIVPDRDTLRVAVGETVTVSARVENVGSATWPHRGAADERYHVKLGGIWFDLVDGGQRTDEARGRLPYDLPPGASTRMSLALQAPTHSGEYRIELDVLQEGVCWFGDRGSARAHIACRVDGHETGSPPDDALVVLTPPARTTWPTVRRRLGATVLGRAYRAVRRRLSWWRSQRARRRDVAAVMEMHAIPEEEVRPVIIGAGGRLVTIDRRIEDDGVETSCYWVTR